ncbi:SIP domain-containing protein [Salinibacterium sp. G-O1]|uniref:SIP domain-containing protein n=1 Tax=Salinibacterium sp. G-O1 TaxID=3046208 RepID=UPI0024BA240D|nr:SIP domain-containing protein [Salinibacterium sp. G-O1]MDJ0334631.1 SIP domain-containing protein [Salinibacterium sp. G-O1]
MITPETYAASIAWNPRDADRLLLAGDEHALDTIKVILATLPAKSRGQVFIEVQSEADIELIAAPGRFAVCWLVRDRGQAMRRSVDAWLAEMLPVSAFGESTVYSWIASDGQARLLSSN